MSVVGPRPLLVKYLPLYNEHQARRHEVRPGFTGYAQANGRNALSWEQKFDMDVEYVDHEDYFSDSENSSEKRRNQFGYFCNDGRISW